MRIEETILSNLFQNDEFTRKAIPFIKGEYFSERGERIIFEEFEKLQNQVLYVSATPADYELNKSDGIFTEQIIRPTGLLDPVIEVRASKNQIDDIIEEINNRVLLDERAVSYTHLTLPTNREV